MRDEDDGHALDETHTFAATGSTLRALREHFGRSLGDVAAAGGVSVPGLSRFETGQRQLGLKIARAYSLAIGVEFRIVAGDVEAVVRFENDEAEYAFLAKAILR